MEDLLAMSMDQINDLMSHQHQKNNHRQVNPFDHYEVSVAQLETVYTDDDFRNASLVYYDVNHLSKAVIHVKGTSRIVKLTNDPFRYKNAELVNYHTGAASK